MIILRLFFAIIRIPIIIISVLISPIDWKLARDLERLFSTNLGFWEQFQPGYWDTDETFPCPRCGKTATFYKKTNIALCPYHGQLLYTEIPKEFIKSNLATVKDIIEKYDSETQRVL